MTKGRPLAVARPTAKSKTERARRIELVIVGAGEQGGRMLTAAAALSKVLVEEGVLLDVVAVVDNSEQARRSVPARARAAGYTPAVLVNLHDLL